MELQTWREFKAKIMLAGQTQEEIARTVGASRTAIRRAVKKKGCKRVRTKLIELQLLTDHP